MTCKFTPKKGDISQFVGRCEVGFQVRLDEGRGSCSTSCFLIYVFDRKNPENYRQGAETLFGDCLEHLNSVECD